MPLQSDAGSPGLGAVRVNADNPSEKLRPQSLINYDKLYNVEHNVPVRNFGKILDRDLERFIAQGWEALQTSPHRHKRPLAIQEHGAAAEARLGHQGSYTSAAIASNLQPDPTRQINNQISSLLLSPSMNSSTKGATINAATAGRSNVAAPPTNIEPVVHELAQRIQQRRPEAGWELCVKLAEATVAKQRARQAMKHGSISDEDSDDSRGKGR